MAWANKHIALLVKVMIGEGHNGSRVQHGLRNWAGCETAQIDKLGVLRTGKHAIIACSAQMPGANLGGWDLEYCRSNNKSGRLRRTSRQ